MVRAEPTDIPGVVILEPRVFEDERGFFFESYNDRAFAEATGLDPRFVQDNHSRSLRGVLRGLHYQVPPHAQGKLVRAVSGRIWDVAVDLRTSSPTFQQWVGVELDDESPRQLWIPPGFGHGFVVLSEFADVVYKTTDYYAPDCDRSLRWDDPEIGIEWPLDGEPVLSPKDAAAPGLREAEVFA